MTTKTEKHTPTPWILNGHNAYVDGATARECVMRLEAGSPADRAFIVRAVNSHARLIDALERALGDYRTGTWDQSTTDYIKDTIEQTEGGK